MRGPLILALVILAPSVPAAGQEAQSSRSGLWVTIGGGAARNRVDCDNCGDIGRYWGGMVFVRAGGSITERVRLGAEGYTWQRGLEEEDSYLRGVQGIVLWYPSFPARGFFVQAGLGLARLHSDFQREGAPVRAAETGMSVMLGVGYDIPITRRLLLTPVVSSTAVPTATIDTPSGPLENVVGTLFLVGLGVTWD
jgi:hypothetical protein